MKLRLLLSGLLIRGLVNDRPATDDTTSHASLYAAIAARLSWGLTAARLPFTVMIFHHFSLTSNS